MPSPLSHALVEKLGSVALVVPQAIAWRLLVTSKGTASSFVAPLTLSRSYGSLARNGLHSLLELKLANSTCGSSC